MYRIFLLLLLPGFFSACDPFNAILEEDDVVYYHSDADSKDESEVGDTLKVMTWNVKFGGARIDFFFDCHGDRVLMESSEVVDNLKRLSAFLKATRPDILFVQEVDVNSKRSAFVDQVEWLLENSHFSYAAYASQWRVSHIPSDGLGRMDSGNAIFSVTPLFKGRRVGLPLIGEQNFLVRYFYLRRNLLDVSTVIGKDTLHLLNTHLSAYSNDGTKEKQIDVVYSYLDSLDRLNLPFVIGGDFNALPPGTKNLKGFPDSACDDGEFEADDYSLEQTWMRSFYDQFQAAVSLEKYQVNNSVFFTHTTDKNGFWNRKLDYLFTNSAVLHDSTTTHQTEFFSGMETMPLSDHCALETVVVLRKNP
ncbi:endonuclease/exonuclease/phosphatase family protein [Marinilabilia rubra]|uniref:Endonuclease n=1 Tax=Marinilabilia rubra TaxID=2162893 RepID=A0A2U2B8F3_9BACT|nr:endonuclease/exonuclease/phosphatase family protein [Marinilabilia rubra]PWD99371.1 endonuclease [Marinilabilia rubra]